MFSFFKELPFRWVSKFVSSIGQTDYLETLTSNICKFLPIFFDAEHTVFIFQLTLDKNLAIWERDIF